METFIIKFSKDVTKVMLEDSIEQILEDIQKEQNEAAEAYEKDKSDAFHQNMSIMYQLVSDMILARLSPLLDDDAVGVN